MTKKPTPDKKPVKSPKKPAKCAAQKTVKPAPKGQTGIKPKGGIMAEPDMEVVRDLAACGASWEELSSVTGWSAYLLKKNPEVVKIMTEGLNAMKVKLRHRMLQIAFSENERAALPMAIFLGKALLGLRDNASNRVQQAGESPFSQLGFNAEEQHKLEKFAEMAEASVPGNVIPFKAVKHG